MRTLLTQKEQRQLRILEYLFENPSWIHLDPLAEALDINTRIIKSDIKEETNKSFDIFLRISKWPFEVTIGFMEVLGKKEADVSFIPNDRDWSDLEFESVIVLQDTVNFSNFLAKCR